MPKSWTRMLALDGLIMAGWLASVGMAVWHERGAVWGSQGRPTASLAATMEAKDQWFGIYYQGQRIGFSEMRLIPEERQGFPGVGVIDRGQLAVNLLGATQQLEVNARAFIDADWRLQEFSAQVSSPTYHLDWTGRRSGQELIVTVATPTSSVTRRVKDPTGSAFVSGLSSWAAFHRLHVGESGKGWVLNPLALNPEVVSFTVPRSEQLDGRLALIVETTVGGMTTTSWVTPDGEVLRETSPLGWELRRASRQEALQPQIRGAPIPDLLSTTAVPIDRPLEDPERIGRLTLLVEGVRGEAFEIQRPWQRLLPPERLSDFQRSPPHGPWCLVQLERPAMPYPQPLRALPSAIERYRRPSLFVQSDDARIAAKAAAIVGTRTDPWEETVALNQWVFSTLRKQLTVGLPSAVDVLLAPEGDCHEHTVLFTALARSLKLPTRMVAGLVYWQGRLYYHAWPEVWVGEWIPTDPTLGQRIADATHLGLIEAENERLMALGQFIGKLRVHVLQVVESRTHP